MFRLLRGVNRALLGVVGLMVLCAGAMVLAVGVGLSVPSWWPYSGPHDAVLSRADRVRYRDDGWWWPVVIAALAVLVVLALWWLLAQARRSRLADVLVDSRDGESALLRGRALEDVLEREMESHNGVGSARALLSGRSTDPAARMRIMLEPHAAPQETLRRLTEEALVHARDAAGLQELPADVRMRAAKHGAERVR